MAVMATAPAIPYSTRIRPPSHSTSAAAAAAAALEGSSDTRGWHRAAAAVRRCPRAKYMQNPRIMIARARRCVTRRLSTGFRHLARRGSCALSLQSVNSALLQRSNRSDAFKDFADLFDGCRAHPFSFPLALVSPLVEDYVSVAMEIRTVSSCTDQQLTNCLLTHISISLIRQTDRQTDRRQTTSLLNAPAY